MPTRDCKRRCTLTQAIWATPIRRSTTCATRQTTTRGTSNSSQRCLLLRARTSKRPRKENRKESRCARRRSFSVGAPNARWKTRWRKEKRLRFCSVLSRAFCRAVSHKRSLKRRRETTRPARHDARKHDARKHDTRGSEEDTRSLGVGSRGFGLVGGWLTCTLASDERP